MDIGPSAPVGGDRSTYQFDARPKGVERIGGRCLERRIGVVSDDAGQRVVGPSSASADDGESCGRRRAITYYDDPLSQ